MTRAKEARETAAKIADPAAKQAMLHVAANYERIAKRAEARGAGVPFPPREKQGGQE